MNRDFYFYGNLFLGLGVASSVFFTIAYMLIGQKAVTLDSFSAWLIVWTLVTLAASLFLLRYFQLRGYSFVFYVGVPMLIINLAISVVLLMYMRNHALQGLYVVMVSIGTCIGLIHSAGLIFSKAGESRWLKLAGVASLLMGALGAGMLVLLFSGNSQAYPIMSEAERWGWLVRSLIPLFFIAEFRREARKLHQGDTAPMSKSADNLFGTAGVMAFAATLFVGVAISKDALGSRRWDKVNAARAERLAAMSEERTYRNNNGDTLRYLLTRPLDFDPQKKYPLVVCLPYGGYQSPPADWLAEDAVRKAYPAFLLVPYSPPGTSWGGVPEYANRIALDDLVFETLSSLDEPAIDRDRIYVSGVSLGGYGSWTLISKHPETFAAAIPVCGGGNPALAENITGVAVWAFHGAKDVNVPVSGSRDMIEAIKKAGGDPKYTEYGHLAHNIWHDVSKTPGLLAWLFQQRREPG